MGIQREQSISTILLRIFFLLWSCAWTLACTERSMTVSSLAQSSVRANFSTTKNPTNKTSAIPVTVTFSSHIDLRTAGAGDFDIQNGFVDSAVTCSLSNKTCSFSVTPSFTVPGPSGTIQVGLSSNVFNGTAASATVLNIDVDTQAPTFTPTLVSASQGNSATVFEWDIVYSENILSYQILNQLQLSGASQGCSLSMTIIDGLHQRVKVTGCSDDGTLTLTLPAGSIEDLAGNPFLTPVSFPTVDIKNTLPVLTFSSPSVGYQIGNKAILFAVTGLCNDEGRTIDFTPAAETPVLCSGGTWKANFDLTQKFGASLTISGVISDLFGNTQSASRMFLLPPISIYSNGYAFAVVDQNKAVATYGNSAYGGDSSAVSADLSGNVVRVSSTSKSFAALKSDGSVITWGEPTFGGDSSAVSAQLTSNVAKVFGNERAFAALKNDGSVVTWGISGYGGNSGSVTASLQQDVKKIFSTLGAFAALKDDGSVVSWGGSGGGVAPTAVTAANSGVIDIINNDYAFAALKSDGSVVSWGAANYGNVVPTSIMLPDSKVKKLFSNNSSFVALKDDGSVIAWGGGGMQEYGGTAPASVTAVNSGVLDIASSEGAYAALKADGSVVSWGHADYGGTGAPPSVTMPSSGVSSLIGNRYSFAALKTDGSVIAWGGTDCESGGTPNCGGQAPTSVTLADSGVVKIFKSDFAYAALKDDGSVVTWGHQTFGGDSSAVAADLTSDVIHVSGTMTGFAAVKKDGSIVIWGQ
ncbi:hypothetical protein D3C87_144860 [compost metagenome]